MTQEIKKEAAANPQPAVPVKDEKATIIETPEQTASPNPPAGKWGLIIALLVVAAVIVAGAIVALQVLESQFYSQSPSAWPSSSQAR